VFVTQESTTESPLIAFRHVVGFFAWLFTGKFVRFDSRMNGPEQDGHSDA
jgi:hypothetical protein